MKHFRMVLIIGILEILIGGTTLLGTCWSLLAGSNTKSPGVLFFVVTAAVTSSLLGIGILKFKKIAYDLLLYFSSVIILSKVLIALGVFELAGSLETAVPSGLKNGMSVLYHGLIIYCLKRDDIRKIFHI